MINNPEQYVQRLIEVLSKKEILLKELLSLTRQQSEHLHEEGMDRLEKLVGEKQVRIDSIDVLDEEFQVYFYRLKKQQQVERLDQIKDTNIHGIKELKELTVRIMDTVKTISEIEQQNNKKAKALLDLFQSEIKKVHNGRIANSVYRAAPTEIVSYYFDKKK